MDCLKLISPNQAARLKGVFAVCSAHRTVLEAAMHSAKARGSDLLVEATPNQVNQFGGYSGLTPSAFRKMVEEVARNCGFDLRRLIFGADHLGPFVWRNESSAAAMGKALDLTRAFVAAGFRKLHLDVGVALKDDPFLKVSHSEVIDRTLQLLAAAESEHARMPQANSRLVFVIGAEAPTPGGGVEEDLDPVITEPEEITRFLESFEKELKCTGKRSAWRQVVGVVVQPGVDFGDLRVVPYDPLKAAALIEFAQALPRHMTCEVHATDYQSQDALRGLVADGFRILKVGPSLTYAYREAVFALAKIEAHWLGNKKSMQLSHIREVIDAVMVKRPDHWRSHYKGSPSRLVWLRQNSLRDRIRYYWSYPEVKRALEMLLRNLACDLPHELLLSYWPKAPDRASEHRPQTLILHHIMATLEKYAAACDVGVPH